RRRHTRFSRDCSSDVSLPISPSRPSGQTGAVAMTPVRLDSVVAFLSELDRRGVRYAHWKSNEHLEDALRGETDLDLLVDPGDRRSEECSGGDGATRPPAARLR